MDEKGYIIKDNLLDTIEIPLYSLLDGKVKKQKYNIKRGGSLTVDTQLVFPNIIPFSEYKIEYDNIYIKFLDGENTL